MTRQFIAFAVLAAAIALPSAWLHGERMKDIGYERGFRDGSAPDGTSLDDDHSNAVWAGYMKAEMNVRYRLESGDENLLDEWRIVRGDYRALWDKGSSTQAERDQLYIKVHQIELREPATVDMAMLHRIENAIDQEVREGKLK